MDFVEANKSFDFSHKVVTKFITDSTRLNVLTKDGMILVANTKSLNDNFQFEDTVKLPVKDIRIAYYLNPFLILVAGKELYIFKDFNNYEQIRVDSIYYFEHYGNTVFALSRSKIYVIKNGKLETEWHISNDYYYLFPLNDTALIAGGHGAVSLIANGREKIIYNMGKSEPTLEELYRGDIVPVDINYRFGNLFAQTQGVALLYAGRKDTTGQIILMDTRSLKVKKILKLNISPLAISFHDKNFMVAGLHERDFISVVYVIDSKTGNILNSYNFNYVPTSLVSLGEGIWLLSTFDGLFNVFNEEYPHKARNLLFSSNGLCFYLSPYTFDIDGDGDTDYIFTGLLTNSANKEFAEYHILVGLNRIKEIKSLTNSFIQMSKRYTHIFKMFNSYQGLVYIDNAISYLDIISPDSVFYAEEIRSKIYRNYWLYTIYLEIAKYKYLWTILLMLLILRVFYSYIKQPDDNVPGGMTISRLASFPLIHNYPTDIAPLIEDKDFDVRNISHLIKEVLEFLRAKSVKKELMNSSPVWKKFYKRLLKNLKFFCFVSSLPGFLRKLPPVNATTRIKVKELGMLRREFIEDLLNTAKVDVIDRGLLPVIDEFQSKYGDRIKFERRIIRSSQLKMFKDEVENYRRAFKAIIQNAVESFDNYDPGDIPRISVNVEDNLMELLITIEDNGKGIPEEHHSRIFEDGFSLKKGNGSRGFGLSWVTRIIGERCSVSVKSKEGKGTKFTITIKI